MERKCDDLVGSHKVLAVKGVSPEVSRKLKFSSRYTAALAMEGVGAEVLRKLKFSSRYTTSLNHFSCALKASNNVCSERGLLEEKEEGEEASENRFCQPLLVRVASNAGVQKNCLHFSICACHPCAGAMLIFSVSFQF